MLRKGGDPIVSEYCLVIHSYFFTVSFYVETEVCCVVFFFLSLFLRSLLCTYKSWNANVIKRWYRQPGKLFFSILFLARKIVAEITSLMIHIQSNEM